MPNLFRNIPFPREGPQRGPENWANTVDTTVRTWAGVWNQQTKVASFRTPDYGRRQKLDVTNITQPGFAWPAVADVDPLVRTWAGIWNQQTKASSFQTPAYGRNRAARPLDVRNIPQPSFAWDFEGIVDTVLSQWLPVWVEEINSFRSPDRRQIDITSINQPDDGGWNYFVNIPVVPFDPATWPAIFQVTQGFRAGDPLKIDTRNISEPEFGWDFEGIVDTVLSQWLPIWQQELSSFRTPDYGSRQKLDVRNVPEPEFGWVEEVVENILATIVPSLWGSFSYRTQERNKIDVTNIPEPSFAWDFEGIVDTILSQWLPVWEQQAKPGSFVTPRYGRNRGQPIDVTNIPEPSFAWNFEGIVDTVLSQWLPIWIQELSSFRSPERRKLDVANITQPGFAWPQTVLDIITAVTQVVPTFWERISYRARERAKIDVTNISQPQFDWMFKITIDPVLSQWVPIWIQELSSFRSADYGRNRGQRLDVTNITEPEFTWVEPVVDVFIAKILPTLLQEASSFRTRDTAKIDVTEISEPESGWIFTYIPVPTPGGTAVDYIIFARHRKRR